MCDKSKKSPENKPSHNNRLEKGERKYSSLPDFKDGTPPPSKKTKK